MKSNWVLIASIASSGLLATASALAGNGSGYNGPDLNPVSIPVQLDRGISTAAIKTAVTACLVTGDPAQGLESMIHQLVIGQMGNKAVTLNPLNPVYIFLNTGNVKSVYTFVDVTQADGVTLGQSGISLNVWAGNSVMSLTINNTSLETPRENGLFPYISYDKMLSDGSYDDYGRLIEGSQIVSGLTIHAAATSGGSLAQIPLINTATFGPTRFTVNGEEYIQCLQSELQKHADDGSRN
jgi:hypothetical protein